MSNELRKSLLLKQLGQDTAEDDAEEANTLPSLPSLRKSKPTRGNTDLPSSSRSWDEFFQHNEHVQLQDIGYDFNYYYSLPTSLDAPSIPVFIFHHGAGSSALSFANLCKQLCDKLQGKCACFAFDARGHGQTRIIDPGNRDSVKDFTRHSFDTDFTNIITHFVNNILADSNIPNAKISIILIGHSLGGSICTHTFQNLNNEIKAKIIGIAMLDIVEEAAIKALQKVNQFLNSTPNVFNSYQDAIEWHVSHHLSKLRESAEISIPALFTETKSGKIMRITNLSMFTPFWDTWFIGLSHEFINTPTSKLLILAGNDNLDKELIVGQMQGRYQLVVFQDSGHFIQEDAPLKTVVTLIDFWRRNDNKNVVIKSNWGK